MLVNSNNQRGVSTIIFVVIIVILVGVIGLMAMGRRQFDNTPPSVTNTPQTLPSQMPSATLEPSKNSEGDELNYYVITQNFKQGKVYPDGYQSLARYLNNIFGFPNVDDAANEIALSYDTRDSSPFAEDNLSPTYHVVLKSQEIDTSKSYSNEYFDFSIEAGDIKLYPYVTDPEYCESANDCTLRANYCTYGGYNNYHPYTDVWGCGPPSDKTGYTFTTYDESRGCTTDVQFSGITCQNNKCSGVDKKIICTD